MGDPFLKIAPSHRDLESHLTHDSLGPSEPQPKRYLNQFSCLCTIDCRVSVYFTMRRAFPPSKLPFPWGDLDPT